MAQSINVNGQTLYVPNAYSQYSVSAATAGLPTIGVVALVGEATNGSSYVNDTGVTVFGPDEFAAIKAKYGSGPLVDAFYGLVNASADAQIVGVPTQIVMVKTNDSTPAQSVFGTGDYEFTIRSKLAGSQGSSISIQRVAATPSIKVLFDGVEKEVLPFVNTGNLVTITVAAAKATTSAQFKATSFVIQQGTVSKEFFYSNYPNLGLLKTAVDGAGLDGVTFTVLSGSTFVPCTQLNRISVSVATSTNETIGDSFYRMSLALENSDYVELVDVGDLAYGVAEISITATLLGAYSNGITTNSDVSDALEALKGRIKVNFVVPAISADGTGGSTYTFESVVSNVKDFVTAQSKYKAQANCQAVFGVDAADFDAAKTAAGYMGGSFRCAMTFAGCRAVSGVTGSVTTFPAWMTAVKLAGMQAGGAPKTAFNKSVGVNAIIQTSDYSALLNSQVEQALIAGLCPMKQRDDGAFVFVSDQTGWVADNNFVYNSLQAVYVADVVNQTTRSSLERQVIGQTFADLTPTTVANMVSAELDNLYANKFLASDATAPSGYKNVIVKFSQPAINVSYEVKIAGGVYFVPISFTITPVSA